MLGSCLVGNNVGIKKDEICIVSNRNFPAFFDANILGGKGGHFANRSVIVEHRSDDEVVVRLARLIPEGEAWLYENPKALASVRRGLDDARKGNVTKKAPDLKAAAKLAKLLED